MSSLPIKRDFLTNCYAREGLGTIMNTMVEQFQAHGKPFSFFLIDIDHFKHYNDRYGHIHGDEALKYFSSTLRLYLQENECYPFRLGGDEFVVIFPRTTTQECFALAKKLEKALKKRPFIYKDKQMRVISFSGGIAAYPADGQTLEELLEASDRAMYTSKRRGRGRTTQYRSLPALRVTRFLTFTLIATVTIAILIGGGAFLLDKNTFKDNWENLAKKKEALQSELLNKIMSVDLSAIKLPEIKLPRLSSQFENIDELVNKSLKPDQVISDPLKTSETAIQPAQTKQETTTSTIEIPEPPSDPLTTVHLLSGGKVTGILISEDGNEIRLKVTSKYGESSTRIQKSSIKEIERPQ